MKYSTLINFNFVIRIAFTFCTKFSGSIIHVIYNTINNSAVMETVLGSLFISTLNRHDDLSFCPTSLVL